MTAHRRWRSARRGSPEAAFVLGDWFGVCIGSHFWQVNLVDVDVSDAKHSAQPVRYFIYRS